MTRAKVAIVSGAGRGLGAVIAATLAENEYSVALIGRSAADVEKHAVAIRARGYRAISCKCDVTDWKEVQACVRDVNAQLGPPNILVNNAGGWIGDTILDGSVEKFRSLLEATVIGSIQLSKAVILIMSENGGGTILNIGSTSGLPSSRDTAIASVGKAAVRQLTHTMARELAGKNIRVSVLNPARMKKNVVREVAEAPDEGGHYRNLSYEQVAEMVLFVVSQPPNVVIRELTVTPTDVDL